MPPDPSASLTADDFEFYDSDAEDGEAPPPPRAGSGHASAAGSASSSARPSFSLPGARPTIGHGAPPQPSARSQYQVPRSEQLRGVANRIIFSRYYILFYAIMFGLSTGTVVLSLIATHKRQCPPLVWHVLEVIVNGMMVLEVGTRWVAFGKKYPMTPLNIVDLLLVLFCSVTLILVFRSPCSEGTRQEEVLDTLLLVIRNLVQFLRLGNILRRSGHSVFRPPKPIDLSQARTASFALELGLDLDDDEAVAERRLQDAAPAAAGLGGGGGGRRTLARGGGPRAGGYEPIFQDVEDELEEDGDGEGGEVGQTGSGAGAGSKGRKSGEQTRQGINPAYNAGRENLDEDDDEVWDRM